MDQDIKDFVQKLLKKEPRSRLGAGPKGSLNDYNALKNHTLLKGVDFKRVHLKKAPGIDLISTHIKEKKTEFEHEKAKMEPLQKSRKKAFSEDQTSIQGKNKRSGLKRTKYILSGLVRKKCGYFLYRDRQLILESNRILYFDPQTNMQLV